MEQKIGVHENMEFIDRVILNGKVGYVPTEDDNDSTIGVLNVIKQVTFKGEVLVDTSTGFPLSKGMADKLGWTKNYASVRLVTGDTPVDPTKVEEIIIQSYYGTALTQYSHCYSDCTGYLWTDEKFTVGGHDLMALLETFKGKYIHMEIEMYKEKR